MLFCTILYFLSHWVLKVKQQSLDPRLGILRTLPSMYQYTYLLLGSYNPSAVSKVLCILEHFLDFGSTKKHQLCDFTGNFRYLPDF